MPGEFTNPAYIDPGVASNVAAFLAAAAADSTVKIAAETGARGVAIAAAVAAEAALRASAVTAEAATRAAADTAATTARNAEASTRSAADIAISASVTAEASTRAAADTAAATALTNEATARIAADNALTSKINADIATEANSRSAADVGVASAAALDATTKASAAQTAAALDATTKASAAQTAAALDATAKANAVQAAAVAASLASLAAVISGSSDPNASFLQGVTIAGVTPGECNGYYDLSAWDGSSNIAVSNGLGASLQYSTFAGTWQVRKDGTDQGMKSTFATAYSASPGLAAWEPTSGGGTVGTAVDVVGGFTPAFIGQFLRVGASAPYTWWRASSLVLWEIESPMEVGSTAPVAAVRASRTVDPAGVDNSVIYTAAVGSGVAGNDISIAYAAPAVTALTSVSVVGNAITVTPGTKAWMVITGVASPSSANRTLLYAGLNASNNPVWSSDGLSPDVGSGNGRATLRYAGGVWEYHSSTSSLVTYASVVTSVADYPDGLTYDAPTLGTGTPTVTAGISSAAQVITAVNASTPAAALVTAAASGAVTGAVAAVAAANLTGGTAGTASPPLIRVAGGFLYIQESGVWKKAALSAL